MEEHLMKTDNLQKLRADRIWLTEDSCDIDDFRAEAERTTSLADYPNAASVEKNVLIYDSRKVRASIAEPDSKRAILAEICEAFADGPGVVVFAGAYEDTDVIDRASAIFENIIAEQHRSSTGGGDHFAKAGANDRIWNSLEKHCLADPENFAEYYGNPIIALASQAWLGPSYQMTAQVNRVNPGGAAQSAHRDYHLGFQSSEVIQQFPVACSQALAGADAAGRRCPLRYATRKRADLVLAPQPGLRARLSRPQAAGIPRLFRRKPRATAVRKGDVVFFNPALFHAAGTNRSADIKRVANLLQVSSAFGRAMETVDRQRMSATLFPALKKLKNKLSPSETANAIAACAEGYSFPTNLDRDPPVGGMAPKTQAQLMSEALAAGWSHAAFEQALSDLAEKKLS
jgi:ectoine hydroxylase-related dioxygenase (phytanoyl-CoA dioxygenase family)